MEKGKPYQLLRAVLIKRDKGAKHGVTPKNYRISHPFSEKYSKLHVYKRSGEQG